MLSPSSSYFFKIASTETPFISANSGPFIWEQKINKEEFIRLQNFCEQPIQAESSWYHGAIIPTRYNNLENFSIDCCLPTTINYAINIEKSALEVLAVVGSVAFDLATIPLRVITCIPSFFCTNPPDTHPLYRLFTKYFGVSEEILSSGSVRVALHKRKIKPIFGKDNKLTWYNVNEKWKSYVIYFINVPDSFEPQVKSFEKSSAVSSLKGLK